MNSFQSVIVQRTAHTMKNLSVLILFILSKFAKITANDNNVVVNTNSGQVRGVLDEDIDGNKFYSFLGIPYSKPPLGNLRFKPPMPVEPWSNIFDGTKQGSPCVQLDPTSQTYVGQEDCLNLNIFTRTAKTSTLKPVMVYIHGGGYTMGSNTPNLYGPKFLLTEDVVYVSTNYRLGLFGSLFLQDESLGITGNMGLKDVVQALKWLKQNIINFNGDPDNVTIFGISAGGAITNLLTLSPSAQGLFHRAIIQSGCALNPWAMAGNMNDEYKKAIGPGVEADAGFLDYLEKLPAYDVAKLYQKFSIILPHRKRAVGYTIEPPKAQQVFLSEDPVQLLTSGKYNTNVSIIIGGTDVEGCIVPHANGVPIEKWSIEPENMEDYVPFALNYSYGSVESVEIARKLRDRYFGPNRQETSDPCQLSSDINFYQGTLNTMKKFAKFSRTYFYIMTIDTKLNVIKKSMGADHFKGAFHYDDIGYLFNSVLTPPMAADSKEYVGMKRFVKLWTNFARYDNPTPDSSLNVEWKPIDSDHFYMLEIGTELKLIEETSLLDGAKFLNELFEKYPAGLKFT